MKNLKKTVVFGAVLALMSCQQSGPVEIISGKDQCDNCKMTITKVNYATELLTEKGRAYKFDDIMCMDMYKTSNPDKAKNSKQYAVDFESGKFVETNKATFIKGGEIKSPMGGNTQAYTDKATAEKAATKLGASIIDRK
ncbi:MAG: nitrous oxide reductase accessory protein NosL [Cruoricaptor ignavus]|nr:nitrous oxide reductase accessory protein NosL [Cruoricaptor ignavus]